MPVRGHQGQMGQHLPLRAHTGIPKPEGPGIMSQARSGVEREAWVCMRNTWGEETEDPQGLSSLFFFSWEESNWF